MHKNGFYTFIQLRYRRLDHNNKYTNNPSTEPATGSFFRMHDNLKQELAHHIVADIDSFFC